MLPKKLLDIIYKFYLYLPFKHKENRMAEILTFPRNVEHEIHTTVTVNICGVTIDDLDVLVSYDVDSEGEVIIGHIVCGWQEEEPAEPLRTYIEAALYSDEDFIYFAVKNAENYER